MTTSAITFDQMEREAERTLAVVLWAKYVKNMALAAAGMALVDVISRSLVKRFSRGDRLASLSDQQAVDLAKTLQGLHSQLDFMLRMRTVVEWRSKLLFARSLSSLATTTDDLADIIEDLYLSCNPEFRSLLVDCVRALPSHSAELVEHV
jgi:hypothetical protein